MERKVLLIIGNGFDLKCGLETKYIHYFNYQQKKHASFKSFVEALKNNETDSIDYEGLSKEEGISFFDIYFTIMDWASKRLNSDRTWANIEDVLLNGLKKNGSRESNYESCYRCYYAFNHDGWMFSPADFNIEYRIIGHYLCKALKNEIGRTKFFNEFLIDEVNKFSKFFSKYINYQLSQHPDYEEKAQNLIMQITGVGLNECEILSFNYTEPLRSPYLSNIHGLAREEKIVFGITCGKDKDKEETHTAWYYPITKEYKIANVSANGIKVAADYKDITDIYVYGSSLGEQDYDFYENLFDQFDFLMRLYSANIHFCYSLYEGKTKEEIASDISLKATKLVNTIGDNHKSYGLLRSMMQSGHLDFLLIKDNR